MWNRALDRVVSLFAPDAIYRVGGGEHVGHDGMREFLGRSGFRDGQPRWTDDDQLMGRYRDRLRRDSEAGWLFTERTGVSIAKATDPPGHREPPPS